MYNPLILLYKPLYTICPILFAVYFARIRAYGIPYSCIALLLGRNNQMLSVMPVAYAAKAPFFTPIAPYLAQYRLSYGSHLLH